MNDKEKLDQIVAEIKRLYVYWDGVMQSSAATEAVARKNQCRELLSFYDTLQAEAKKEAVVNVEKIMAEVDAKFPKFCEEVKKMKSPRKAKVQGTLKSMLDNMDEESLDKTREEMEKSASKDRIGFKSLFRIYDMIEPTEKAKFYLTKLVHDLEKEGYINDADIAKTRLKVWDGEKVGLATMDEEPVSEEILEASKQYALRQILASTDTEMSEQAYLGLRLFSGFELAVAHKDGAERQMQQLMNNVVLETEVLRDSDGDSVDTPYESWLTLANTEIPELPESLGLKEGDKVKILIVKSE